MQKYIRDSEALPKALASIRDLAREANRPTGTELAETTKTAHEALEQTQQLGVLSKQEKERLDKVSSNLEQAQHDLTARLDEAARAQEQAARTQESLDGKLAALTTRTQKSLDEVRGNITQAQQDAQTAQESLDAAKKTYDQALLDMRAGIAGARERLDEAEANLTAAQTTAETAYSALATVNMQVAQLSDRLDEKTTIITSPATPSGHGNTAGDVWWQTDKNKRIIGQWTWDGHQWTPTSISNEIMASLDVNKLQVVSSATMSEAVVGKLWADGIAAHVGDFQALTVGGANLIPGVASWGTPGTHPGWDAFTVNTDKQAVGLRGRSNGLATVQIRLEAGVRYLFSIDATADTAGTVYYVQVKNTDGSNATFADGTVAYIANRAPAGHDGQWEHWERVFEMATSGTYRIFFYGNNDYGTANEGYQWFRRASIRPMTGSVLIEDGAVTAGKLAAQSVTADKMAANSVTARTLAVVPDEGQGGLKLDAGGIDIIPSGIAAAQPSISMRVDTENSIQFAKNNAITFSVGPDGDLASRSVTANEALTYRGDELQTILDRLPRGMFYRGRISNNTSYVTISSGQTFVAFLHRINIAGRNAHRQLRYLVQVTSWGDGSLNVQMAARYPDSYSISGSDKISRAVFFTSFNKAPASGYYGDTSAWFVELDTDQIASWTEVDGGSIADQNGDVDVFVTMRCDKGKTIRIYSSSSGTYVNGEDLGQTTYQANSPYELTSLPYTQRLYTGGKEQTVTYPASGWAVYDGRGARLTDPNAAYVGNDVQQGALRSIFTFPASVLSDLAGATVRGAYFTIQNQFIHTIQNQFIHADTSGGSTIFKLHGLSSIPTTWNFTRDTWLSRRYLPGQKINLALDAKQVAALQAGTIRGFSMEGEYWEAGEYAANDPAPTLTVTYIK